MKYWLLLLMVIPLSLISQELPPIQTFSPADYSGENQNWSISQSNDKYIYVANNHSLLEFDGINWTKYNSPNGSIIRNVKVIEDRIYTGCYMEFGYWEKISNGTLSYHSLSKELKIPLAEDEEFWNIVPIEDWILFQSLNRIYIYDKNNNSFRIIEAESDKARVFDLKSGIYFQIKDKGIFKLSEENFQLAPTIDQIKDKTVVGLFEKGNSLVFVTEEAEFYQLENGQLNSWKLDSQLDNYSISLYSFKKLNDESLILGTISNGIFHLSRDGKLIQYLNQQKGLNNNTILDIYEDKDSNLWLGHDNGLSVINLDSPFKEYVDAVGNLGVVYASTIFEGKLYLGTNQGLFISDLENTKNIQLINNTEGQVWTLKIIDDRLFCGHHNGTYLISNNTATLISDFPGTWDIKPITANPNLLIQGNYNGLSILEKNNEGYAFRNVLEGFDNSSRFFEFTDKGELFVNHDYKGVFRLKPDSEFKTVNLISKEEGYGTASSLVKFNNKIIYATINGVFSLNETKDQFVIDTTLTNLFQYEDNNSLSILMEDGTDERLWRFGQKDILFISTSKIGTGYKRTVVSLPSNLRNNLGVAGFENISQVSNDKYLIGSSNGYISLDLKKIQSKENYIHLNQVRNHFFDKPPKLVGVDSTISFHHKENNLYFSFAVPEYDKYSSVEYQYKLEGLYDSWSNWGNSPEVTFENLPFGDYNFSVRAKVGNTLTENIESFSFTIERPWYWSNLAIILYIIGLLILFYIIHKIYKAYYRKQQERLIKENKLELKRKKNKARRKIIQIKNEKLKQEIDSKNREVAVSTMSLIKKNEFLRTIIDQLKQAQNPTQIQSVVKMIDKNIDNEEDWNFFEEAFNNADKDFLKKMKSRYPELTPNDLKLCAYLRLNLSSKEIAPLLNISVRSVEIKRYRLRKKMQLEQGASLVNHILSI